MNALIVVAHPEPASLTHSVAEQLAAGVSSIGHTVEIADLAAEGFDPRFTKNDVAVHLKTQEPSISIVKEQQRIDRAAALALVYPVYWWSFPALLKGWIDRVFSNGWAYDAAPDQPLRKQLQRLPVHLVAIGGADLKTYARHGYFGAMRTQIDHGIFEYCGARVATSELLLAEGNVEQVLARARALGRDLFGPTQRQFDRAVGQ
jgi:NAD(P)H dehydrogenase (quinone)